MRPRPPFPQPLPLALQGGYRGTPRPAGRYSHANVSWVFPGVSSQVDLPVTREASRRHPNQMPEPPQLAPLDVKKQRLYSESLPDDRTSHPISKGESRHPAEETHFQSACQSPAPLCHHS
ncbi:hypothetical protein MHYP_G00221050 [Metynnis hypsauchen]